MGVPLNPRVAQAGIHVSTVLYMYFGFKKGYKLLIRSHLISPKVGLSQRKIKLRITFVKIHHLSTLPNPEITALTG